MSILQKIVEQLFGPQGSSRVWTPVSIDCGLGMTAPEEVMSKNLVAKRNNEGNWDINVYVLQEKNGKPPMEYADGEAARNLSEDDMLEFMWRYADAGTLDFIRTHPEDNAGCLVFYQSKAGQDEENRKGREGLDVKLSL